MSHQQSFLEKDRKNSHHHNNNTSSSSTSFLAGQVQTMAGKIIDSESTANRLSALEEKIHNMDIKAEKMNKILKLLQTCQDGQEEELKQFKDRIYIDIDQKIRAAEQKIDCKEDISLLESSFQKKLNTRSKEIDKQCGQLEDRIRMGVSDMQNEIVEQVKAAEARWNHKLNEIGNSKSTGQQARQQQQVVSEAVQSEINEQIERQKKEIDAYLDLIAAKVKAETQGKMSEFRGEISQIKYLATKTTERLDDSGISNVSATVNALVAEKFNHLAALIKQLQDQQDQIQQNIGQVARLSRNGDSYGNNHNSYAITAEVATPQFHTPLLHGSNSLNNPSKATVQQSTALNNTSLSRINESKESYQKTSQLHNSQQSPVQHYPPRPQSATTTTTTSKKQLISHENPKKHNKLDAINSSPSSSNDSLDGSIEQVLDKRRQIYNKAEDNNNNNLEKPKQLIKSSSMDRFDEIARGNVKTMNSPVDSDLAQLIQSRKDKLNKFIQDTEKQLKDTQIMSVIPEIQCNYDKRRMQHQGDNREQLDSSNNSSKDSRNSGNNYQVGQKNDNRVKYESNRELDGRINRNYERNCRTSYKENDSGMRYSSNSKNMKIDDDDLRQDNNNKRKNSYQNDQSRTANVKGNIWGDNDDQKNEGKQQNKSNNHQKNDRYYDEEESYDNLSRNDNKMNKYLHNYHSENNSQIRQKPQQQQQEDFIVSPDLRFSSSPSKLTIKQLVEQRKQEEKERRAALVSSSNKSYSEPDQLRAQQHQQIEKQPVVAVNTLGTNNNTSSRGSSSKHLQNFFTTKGLKYDGGSGSLQSSSGSVAQNYHSEKQNNNAAKKESSKSFQQNNNQSSNSTNNDKNIKKTVNNVSSSKTLKRK